MTALTLPGYTGAGPEHWLTHWERLHPRVRRVEQADWDLPDLAGWIARLEAAVRRAAEDSAAPVLLAAHSLGCLLLAHWSGVSASTGRIAGALLVAPPDIEQPGVPAVLEGFAPIPRLPLPFRSIVVASSADSWSTPLRTGLLAQAWGSELVHAGPVGHLDSAAGLGAWPAGWALLQSLAQPEPRQRAGSPARDTRVPTCPNTPERA